RHPLALRLHRNTKVKAYLPKHIDWCKVIATNEIMDGDKKEEAKLAKASEDMKLSIMKEKFSAIVEFKRPCGNKHQGNFYYCTTCFNLFAHKDCVFLRKKLLIQNFRKDGFFHAHSLTLAYSFPKDDQKAKFDPRYCATTSKEASLNAIRLNQGTSTISKNYSDSKYPYVLHLPFSNTTDLLNHFVGESGSRAFETNLSNQFHRHPLSLVDTPSPTSSRITTSSIHDSMKMVEVPDTISHKYDKHQLTLRYFPVENHSGDYFCEVCEEEFNPNGVESDGECANCGEHLQDKLILKCLQCKFAIDIDCARKRHPLALRLHRNTKVKAYPKYIDWCKVIATNEIMDGYLAKASEDMKLSIMKDDKEKGKLVEDNEKGKVHDIQNRVGSVEVDLDMEIKAKQVDDQDDHDHDLDTLDLENIIKKLKENFGSKASKESKEAELKENEAKKAKKELKAKKANEAMLVELKAKKAKKAMLVEVFKFPVMKMMLKTLLPQLPQDTELPLPSLPQDLEFPLSQTSTRFRAPTASTSTISRAPTASTSTRFRALTASTSTRSKAPTTSTFTRSKAPNAFTSNAKAASTAPRGYRKIAMKGCVISLFAPNAPNALPHLATRKRKST
nr:zinc finger, PHD-type [Tanacetum cinerariifolium]